MKDLITDGYIFPFLWVHGENREKIYSEIKAIYNAGVKMFCVESRPHPEFCKGEKWWSDFGYILSVAEEFGMKVWLLDDKHFPTGYAAGEVAKHPELRQRNIRIFNTDFYSDGYSHRLLLCETTQDRAIVSVLFKRKGDGIDYASGIDVTDEIKDNVLYIREGYRGYYRVVTLFSTTRFSSENYIDMLNPDSTDLLLNAVYEPTYAHYKEKFGNTFIGFFSDEPAFQNPDSEAFWAFKSMYRKTLGTFGIAYPWRDDLPGIMGVKDKKSLIGLWYKYGDYSRVRIDYMNAITKLYSENFPRKLGGWCAEHGVLYTGHIVEDMGAHCRLGSGAGHYFRAMRGQDMSGVDVVLHQIAPDFIDKKRWYPCPDGLDDPDFFNFTLAKLGVSDAHLDKRKQNRTMCEIFGAYGWGENVNTMKRLIDFMLVRGVNYFVPHAFDPAENDDDCPPHFYENGKNPQYSAFCELMKYTQRMSGILSAPYMVKVGVLYHAENEWSGKSYRPMDSINRLFTENQIDFEIIPSEYIGLSEAEFLIVPYAKEYSEEILSATAKFKGKTIFADRDNKSVKEFIAGIKIEYYLEKPDDGVRVLKRGDNYFIVNEGIERATNKLVTADSAALPFNLESGESVLLNEKTVEQKYSEIIAELKTECSCSVRSFDETEFKKTALTDYTEDINDIENYENFCGVVRYETTFEAKSEKFDKCEINFGTLSGGLKVTLNGKEYPELFGAPYRIDVTDAIKERNELRFELSTTLALHYKDFFSKYCRLDKCGLNSRIKIIYMTTSGK